jgi:predicted alpha/beta hydrolase
MFHEFPSKLKLFNSLRQRALAYSFSDDPFAPREAVEDLLQYYRNLNIRHRHFRPQDVNLNSIGHFAFFRKSSKEIFWEDIASWLSEEMADAQNGARQKLSNADL